MATIARSAREPVPTAEYARLEERILARDQKGASDALYGLMKQERPVTAMTHQQRPGPPGRLRELLTL